MRLLSFSLAALFLVACSGNTNPPGVTPPARSMVPTRALSLTADLTGKVKAPATLLSNNSAGLISDRGAGVVANNGAGVVTNNGANWRLLAAAEATRHLQAATPWVVLGGVSVTLVDARGKAWGAPITTGADGAFRFPAVSTGSAWVVRASLGEGRTLEALARAGNGEATVSPATTTALAVARDRTASLEAIDLAAVAKLTQEVEAAQVRDDGLIDLAKPLDAFSRIAAGHPAAAAAADALAANASPAPAPSAGVGTAAGVGLAGGTNLTLAGGGRLFATLPEAPSDLATSGERVLVVLPAARSVRTDAGGGMAEVAALDFTPSALAANATDAYVYDRAGARFARFTLQEARGQLSVTASGERKFSIVPAPAITRAAVDAAGMILASTSDFSMKMGGGDPVARLSPAGTVSLSVPPGAIRGVGASGSDTFWLGTDAASDNLYQFQAGKAIGTPLTISHPIRDVAVAPDGTVYVATADPRDGLFRVAGGVVTSLAVRMPLDHVTVTAGGALRALAGRDLYVWDPPSAN